jgi:hypothetical protein
MKVGDLVRVKCTSHRTRNNGFHPIGVIISTLEANDGFYHFEVVYTFMGGLEREWLSDLQLEVINENR